MPKGIAIGFAAVSSKAQAEDEKISLPQQQAEIEAWCKREDYQLREVLSVPGHSRNYRSVEAMNQAMLKDGIHAIAHFIRHVEAQDFDVLVCRSLDRLGRSQGILSQMIEMVIEDARAKIYTYAPGSSGWLDDVNSAMQIAIAGFMTATHKQGLTKLRDMGMRKRTELGLQVSSHMPPFHRYTFDGSGSQIKSPGADGNLYYMTVDRTYQRLFDDLYDLLVNHHASYDGFEIKMVERGHLNHRGKRYYHRFFADKIWQSPFHGALSFGDVNHRVRWRIDPAYQYQIPEGTTVAYGVCEPIYIGSVGELFRHEMYRRQEIAGNAKPSKLHRFSGLLICGECGYSLSFVGSGAGANYHYYRCASKHMKRTLNRRIKCSQERYVKEDDVQTFLTQQIPLLLASLDGSAIAQFYRKDRQPAPQIEAELVDVRSRHDTLLERLADPRMKGASLDTAYETLQRLSEQIALLERQLVASQQVESAARSHQTVMQSAISEVNPALLWTLDDTTINHILHRFFDPIRIECIDGEPIRFVSK